MRPGASFSLPFIEISLPFQGLSTLVVGPCTCRRGCSSRSLRFSPPGWRISGLRGRSPTQHPRLHPDQAVGGVPVAFAAPRHILSHPRGLLQALDEIPGLCVWVQGRGLDDMKQALYDACGSDEQRAELSDR